MSSDISENIVEVVSVKDEVGESPLRVCRRGWPDQHFANSIRRLLSITHRMKNEGLERDRWTRNESHKRHRDITRGLQVEMTEIGDTGYLLADPFLELESRSVIDSLRAFAEILTDWYQNACVVTGAAVSDIKTLWIITSGSYLHKGKIVGKLVSYYLIVLAIYIIETAFWVDKRIIEVLSNIIIEARESNQVMLALTTFLLLLLTSLFSTITPSPCKN